MISKVNPDRFYSKLINQNPYKATEESEKSVDSIPEPLHIQSSQPSPEPKHTESNTKYAKFCLKYV